MFSKSRSIFKNRSLNFFFRTGFSWKFINRYKKKYFFLFFFAIFIRSLIWLKISLKLTLVVNRQPSYRRIQNNFLHKKNEWKTKNINDKKIFFLYQKIFSYKTIHEKYIKIEKNNINSMFLFYLFFIFWNVLNFCWLLTFTFLNFATGFLKIKWQISRKII